MSLTILTAPDNYTSVNNEMIFVIEEPTKTADPVTYPDYKFILDIYVDSVLIQRQVVRPRPDNNFGVFDISSALQPLMTYGLRSTGSTDSYTPKINYRIQLGEEYDGTQYTGMVNDSSDRTVFNSFNERPFTTPVVMSAGPQATTNYGFIKNNHRDQLYNFISFYADVSGVTDITVTHKNGSGATVQTDIISNAGFVGGTIKQINLGLAAISIPDTAEYAIITGANGVFNNLRLNYLCESKYTAFTLAWLNRYGAYESQSFGLVSKKTTETERKMFSKLPYTISDDGTEIVYTTPGGALQGSKKQFATNTKTRLNLTSHLLTDAEYEIISTLFYSTDVYMYNPDAGSFMPITIIDTGYEFRTYKNSQLTPLNLTVDFTDDFNSQFL